MDLVDGTDKEKWHQPKHLRSEIWKYFKLNEECKKAKCNQCPSILKYMKVTSTLWAHLKKAHKIEPCPTIANALAGPRESLSQAYAEMVAVNNIPFSFYM